MRTLVALLLACADPPDAVLDDTDVVADDTVGDSVEETVETVDTVETAETVDTPDEAPALTLVSVEINQGAGVPVWADGAAVVERNAPLIVGRDALFRVFVAGPSSPVEVSVDLHNPDSRWTTTFTPSAAPSLDDPATGAQIAVPGASIGPDTTWQIAWSADGTAEALAPQLPVPIAADHARMRLRVAIVPVAYDHGACHTLANPTGVEDALWQAFPIAELDVRVHAPLAFTRDLGTAAGVSDVLTATWRLRAADAPDDDVYYVALYDNCGACVQYGGAVGICYKGQSWAIARDTHGAAENRVAVGQIDYLPWILQHELGHLHGQEHVACPFFDSGGTTPDYPYADGLIGSWGYGVRDGQLRSPLASYDLMSNCEPGWPSDWTWGRLAQRVRTLSAW